MTDHTSDEPNESERPTSRAWIIRLTVLLTLVAGVVVILVAFRDEVSLSALAEREQAIRDVYQQHPMAFLAVAFCFYVVVTALSVPFAATMSLVYAWLMGFWTTLVLVSFASTTGATLAFLLSRYLIGKTIQARFSQQLVRFNRAIEREGAFYLFLLRLTPAVPYFVVNAVMGLTKLRVGTFWWVSQLGMLPGTCVYIYAGSSIPTLRELADEGTSSILKPGIIFAFVLLGVFPLAIKKLIGSLRKRER